LATALSKKISARLPVLVVMVVLVMIIMMLKMVGVVLMTPMMMASGCRSR